MTDKVLGHATAYGYYKAGGGTMTEAEFTEFMADFGTASQTAVEAAQAALASETASRTAATTATNKATEATTAATTATTKAGEASTSASTATSAKDTAVSASQTATSKAAEATTAAATATSAATTATTAKDDAVSAKTAAQTAQTGAETAAASVQSSAAQIATNTEDVAQLKSDLTTLESDGVVPSAEQILTDKGITDSVPYHYRATGGDGADRLYDQIVGGTVCFNQLVTTSMQTSTVDGITFTNNGDGTWTVNGTATADAVKAISVGVYPPSGHVISVRGCPAGGSPTTYFVDMGRTSKDVGNGLIDTCQSTLPIRFIVKNGTTVNNLVFKPQAYDLTAMFGSTIADYIYSLETAHAGDGVAFFKSLFPNDYYEYNSGELISVSGLSEHKMTGFNQWDEEWELGWVSDSGANIDNANIIRSKNYIPVFPSTDYYFKTPQTSTMVFFDRNKNCLGHIDANGLSDITAGGAIRKTLDNCYYIRIWVRNSTTYNHDICINLSDPAKNGTYEPYESHSYPLDSNLTLRGLFKLDANNNLYADGDTYDADGTVTRNTILRAYQSGDESLANAITDGTNTVVYSANASTEQATPYQHLQQCDPNGTEEYVSTGIVPVGHNSFYPENLRAKIEQLPWNFASLIAPTESTFTATRNYTTGSLFIVDNVLYKATSNIANGGTITPNTNCTATTLAEIISALA